MWVNAITHTLSLKLTHARNEQKSQFQTALQIFLLTLELEFQTAMQIFLLTLELERHKFERKCLCNKHHSANICKTK